MAQIYAVLFWRDGLSGSTEGPWYLSITVHCALHELVHYSELGS